MYRKSCLPSVHVNLVFVFFFLLKLSMIFEEKLWLLFVIIYDV